MQPDVPQNVLGTVARRVFPDAAAEDGTPNLRIDDLLFEFFRGRNGREFERHVYALAGLAEEPLFNVTKNWGFSRRPGRSSRMLLSMRRSPDGKSRMAQ